MAEGRAHPGHPPEITEMTKKIAEHFGMPWLITRDVYHILSKMVQENIILSYSVRKLYGQYWAYIKSPGKEYTDNGKTPEAALTIALYTYLQVQKHPEPGKSEPEDVFGVSPIVQAIIQQTVRGGGRMSNWLGPVPGAINPSQAEVHGSISELEASFEADEPNFTAFRKAVFENISRACSIPVGLLKPMSMCEVMTMEPKYTITVPSHLHADVSGFWPIYAETGYKIEVEIPEIYPKFKRFGWKFGIIDAPRLEECMKREMECHYCNTKSEKGWCRLGGQCTSLRYCHTRYRGNCYYFYCNSCKLPMGKGA